MGPEDWDDFIEFDIGEGAYHSDEENRCGCDNPYPDELWEREFEDIE